jgi:alpha-mannosidase
LEISTLKLAHPDGEMGGWDTESIHSNPKICIAILRIVNYSPKQIRSAINLSKMPVVEIRECDLLERPIENSDLADLEMPESKLIDSEWRPFEIKSFALKLELP